MSFREEGYFSKDFLILNAEDISIHHSREKHIISEYKKLYNEKESLDKELDILVYVKRRNLLNIIKIFVLKNKISKNQEQLHSIEESDVLSDLIKREQKRRKKELRREQWELENQKAKEAEIIIATNPPVIHNDAYYDKLWKTNEEDFWKQLKLEWRAKHPKEIGIDGIPLEKRCEYLSWMLSVAGKWSIVEMRQKLISTNKKNAQSMCALEVIDRYDYYFPMVK